MRNLVERSESGGAVLAIEDVHLADVADLELLGLLLDHAPVARLLILLTCRTPFDPKRIPMASCPAILRRSTWIDSSAAGSPA